MKTFKLLSGLLTAMILISSCENINKTYHLHSVENKTDETIFLNYQSVTDTVMIQEILFPGGFVSFRDFEQIGDNGQLTNAELADIFSTFEITIGEEAVPFDLDTKEWIYVKGWITSSNDGSARVHDYRLEITDEDLDQ